MADLVDGLNALAGEDGISWKSSWEGSPGWKRECRLADLGTWSVAKDVKAVETPQSAVT